MQKKCNIEVKRGVQHKKGRSKWFKAGSAGRHSRQSNQQEQDKKTRKSSLHASLRYLASIMHTSRYTDFWCQVSPRSSPTWQLQWRKRTQASTLQWRVRLPKAGSPSKPFGWIWKLNRIEMNNCFSQQTFFSQLEKQQTCWHYLLSFFPTRRDTPPFLTPPH